MDNRSPDSGLELVLDNRGLIITFALLIFVCGIFFVLGFIEGKRQGAAASAKTTTEVKPPETATSSVAPGASQPAANSGAEAVKEQLDWYSNVAKRGQAAAKLESLKTATNPVADQPEVAKGAAPLTAKLTYTVQVGAFRKREDAESRAKTLEAKGYQYLIDPPVEPERPLYLLKVGKYNSRAEAVAVALRLKKDGFSTFIKTN